MSRDENDRRSRDVLGQRLIAGFRRARHLVQLGPVAAFDLGWPEQTPELKYYYPTSTLVTSRDIITLWVARMVLTGLYNVGDVPFRDVFIHPKILDGFGEGMSKSKGNGVDPLDVIEKFGADALRFALAHMTTETQDVRMPVDFECPHCHALDRADEEESRAAARRMQKVRPAVRDPMGQQAGRRGAAARGGDQRAVRAGPQFLQQAVERQPDSR